MKLALVRTGNIMKVGLQSIARNTLRSALTMLGIIIGVACVIAMVAVAGGASAGRAPLPLPLRRGSGTTAPPGGF